MPCLTCPSHRWRYANETLTTFSAGWKCEHHCTRLGSDLSEVFSMFCMDSPHYRGYDAARTSYWDSMHVDNESRWKISLVKQCLPWSELSNRWIFYFLKISMLADSVNWRHYFEKSFLLWIDRAIFNDVWCNIVWWELKRKQKFEWSISS